MRQIVCREDQQDVEKPRTFIIARGDEDLKAAFVTAGPGALPGALKKAPGSEWSRGLFSKKPAGGSLHDWVSERRPETTDRSVRVKLAYRPV